MLKQLRERIAVLVLLLGVGVCGPLLAQGKLEHIKVFGPSLKGNLEGDNPEREVLVYLPASYDKGSKRYPVIYFLHGYGVTAQFYADTMQLPESADQVMAADGKEAIVVLPDAKSVYDGSMYSSSLTTGDWETYISQTLVNYIDKHYRTIAKRASRGLSGHSMGGYGTLRIGMKHPEVFGALYAMSSCCLMNRAPSQEAVDAQIKRLAAPAPAAAGARPGFANVLEAQAAAWAPNPHNPPYFFDWGYQDGKADPVVQGKWIANSPLVFVDQYVPALKQYKAIMLDVGDKDTLFASNTQMEAALTRLGVAHGWEVYDGDHTNRVPQRFAEKLLPFFAKQLSTK